MKKKIMNWLDKPLTRNYICKYLRSKGLAADVIGEESIVFKLYDKNWWIRIKDNHLCFSIAFGLGKELWNYGIEKSTNVVNMERFAVKVFIHYNEPTDDDGKVISDAEGTHSIMFSSEVFCYRASDFDNIYEYIIFSLTDAIEFHHKVYSQLIEDANQQNDKTNQIGFTANNSDGEKKDEPKACDKTRRKIGFV